MIVLDTNVISNLVGERPSEVVQAWFESLADQDLYLTVITETELLRGTANMPEGKKRSLLESLYRQLLQEEFADRILVYDSRAARAYAEIEAGRRALGRPIAIFDCQIAAIAKINGFKIATRNIEDFEDCGLELIDPWMEA